MEISIFFLLASLLLDLYVVRKLCRKGDLNLFDIITVFYSLYFVLIPLKGVVSDGQYRGDSILEIVSSSFLPSLYIFIIKIIFLLINIYITNAKKESYYNISHFFYIENEKVKLPPQSIYLFIIVFLIALKPIISYGDLTEDDVEGNLTYFYGANLPLYERLIANMIRGAMPAFVLLSIKYHIEIQASRYRKWSYINLCIILACTLLSGRTNCFNILTIVLLYLYSCQKDLFTFKRIGLSAMALIFMVLVYFPLYQAFRMTKEVVVTNFTSHDFLDVASYFIKMDPKEFGELYEKATQSSEGRSFNVYMAFYEACTKNYESTSGYYVIENIMCLNPLQSPDASKSNIYAELLEGGGDIAESLPTVLYADIGYLFFFMIPVFYLGFFYLLWLIIRLAQSIFKTRELTFLFVSLIIVRCLTVEGSVHIREVYNPDVIVIFVFAFILRIYSQLCKNI